MSPTTTSPTTGRSFLGLSPALLWGYVAIAFFMTGDGLEQAFLSDYLVTHAGFTTAQTGSIFTVYGLIVALGAFASGVLAEYFGPRRVMILATIMWIVFHVGFLYFGVMQGDFAMTLVMYAIRAAAYPMFVYSFVVWISYAAPGDRLSSAMGWFWCFYSIGVGVFGSYLPSLTIPWIGEIATLWASIAFIAVGGLLAGLLVRGRGPEQHGPRTLAGLLGVLTETLVMPVRNVQLAYGMIQRIINQISLYGFIVMLPIVFVRDLGFAQGTWLKLWSLVYLVTVFTNLLWGVLGDRIGWVRTVRWFGAIGMCAATLLLYFVPVIFGPNPWLTAAAVVVFGFALAAYVPLSALMPALEPHRRGSAVALLNLAAGLSQFIGSLMVTLLWDRIGTTGTVIALAATYLVSFGLSFLQKVDQRALAQDAGAPAASPAAATAGEAAGR
ncbi:MFS transporter [Brachybacterium phenoliresistens]|uniref:MFS transporter n=1 Tax=Brachybacterium phenoliresistens TaxID=396014 RepID=Z9JVA5_9MICO|nr:MFS transporter [Brachybacterium phenoliresistens]EWS82109.1 MFS transporter [Brachybacterium phenoliresistens]